MGGGLHKNIKPKTNQWLVHSKDKLSSFLHLQIQKKKQISSDSEEKTDIFRFFTILEAKHMRPPMHALNEIRIHNEI